ncbi:hypothetical protein [Sulfuriroseicoccus oceanibius]|uniref:Uncharacterized protein n=1 Tax=Sulfuriroseicoccus oceanibius TaxID=2707525 RepID=A0A6B3L5S4_9BACT|nr:hypothetical protein [Sulfuriroseicoccus oceanibius]QQL45235.1 hypothetical protein G3M56_001210 [Sulfuriroseicoccus oceanibius]
MRVFSAFLMFVVMVGVSSASADDDPFAAVLEDVPEVETFETSSFFKVTCPREAGHAPIEEGVWPKVESPTSFNRLFERPSKVWRHEGGYFGAFDAGEFGGGLFFVAANEERWIRLVDTHVQDLARFDKDTFLAVGGLGHRSFAGGDAYLITRDATGEWTSRKVFASSDGIPRIIGVCGDSRFDELQSEKLYVIELVAPRAAELALFGIDREGALHYLGERWSPKHAGGHLLGAGGQFDREISVAEVELELKAEWIKSEAKDGDDYVAYIYDEPNKGERILFSDLKGGAMYEVLNVPMPHRYNSHLLFSAPGVLNFNRWSTPHYALHYEIDLLTRKLKTVEIAPDRFYREQNGEGAGE